MRDVRRPAEGTLDGQSIGTFVVEPSAFIPEPRRTEFTTLKGDDEEVDHFIVGKSPSRLITLRYAGACLVCKKPVDAGTKAWWDASARSVTCAVCRPAMDAPSKSDFAAGRSAQRAADRKRAKERQDWDDARVVKKAVILWQAKPSKARSWSRGAEGERIVGALLDRLEQQGVIAALHDIRIPGSSANVDHVAVAPSGVHIIDAKFYKNVQIEVLSKGGLLRPDVQLRVRRRNKTSLVDKLAKQILTVDAAMRDTPLPTPVTPVLCFVDALWGVFRKQYKRNGVHIVPPRKLEQLLRRPGPLSAKQIRGVGELLRTRLRPA